MEKITSERFFIFLSESAVTGHAIAIGCVGLCLRRPSPPPPPVMRPAQRSAEAAHAKVEQQAGVIDNIDIKYPRLVFPKSRMVNFPHKKTYFPRKTLKIHIEYRFPA